MHPLKVKFAPDSPLERDGFELSVPRQRISVYRVNPLGCFRGIGASERPSRFSPVL